MGQKFSATFDAVATTAQSDIFELTAASTCSVIVHAVYLGQSSDFGDAQAELLKIQFITGFTTSGSGGSAPTINNVNNTATAASAIEANNTTVANTGTTKTIHQEVWNVMIPYMYIPTPDFRIELAPSRRLVVRLPAPADSLTLNGTIIWEEIGGA